MYDKSRELNVHFQKVGLDEYLTDGFRKDGYIQEYEFVKVDNADLIDGEFTFNCTVYEYLRH